MTDNPIAAALRAACVAACECEGQCYSRGAGNSSGSGICMAPNSDRPAAAIVAFLRALPFAQYIETPRGPVGTGHWLDWIADAVEQEARHD